MILLYFTLVFYLYMFVKIFLSPKGVAKFPLQRALPFYNPLKIK